MNNRPLNREELIAINKAYHLSIGERSYLSQAFHYRETGKSGDIGYVVTLETWDFEGDTATRKADGFTITRQEIDNSEVWT